MSNKSYKELQEELDAVLQKIQSQEIDVDEAINLYKQGEKLIEELEKYLKTAENKIKKLKLKE